MANSSSDHPQGNPQQTDAEIIRDIRNLFPRGVDGRAVEVNGVGFYITHVDRPTTLSFPGNRNYFLFPNYVQRTDIYFTLDENHPSLNRQELIDLRQELSTVMRSVPQPSERPGTSIQPSERPGTSIRVISANRLVDLIALEQAMSNLQQTDANNLRDSVRRGHISAVSAINAFGLDRSHER